MISKVDPFRIRDHVRDFDFISQQLSHWSDDARTLWRATENVAYGQRAAERLDLFFPREMAQKTPIHIFVHGGYWRTNRKEDYAFIANVVCNAGAIAAIVGYSLVPTVRLAAQVGQIRNATAWLRDNAVAFGGDPDRISASGHSAGAHLASYLAGRGSHEANFPLTPVTSVLLISGIFDLRPISESFLQPELKLTEDEILELSPVTAMPSAVPVTLLVGEMETEPFMTQAASYATKLTDSGFSVRMHSLTSHDHISIVAALGKPGSAPAEFLEAAIRVGGVV